jgi:hypothetical protein
MKDDDTIEAAWKISNLMNTLNDIIWEHYEEAFIDRYIKEEKEKYWEEQETLDLQSDSLKEPF